MAGRLLSLHPPPTSLSPSFTKTKHAPNNLLFPSVRISIPSSRRTLQLERRYRLLVPVPRAGGQLSTGSLLLAFLLPLSLILGTIFAASRIADGLDEKYLDEFEENLAIMEETEMANEGEFQENEDENAEVVKKDEFVTATRTRSRPKREL